MTLELLKKISLTLALTLASLSASHANIQCYKTLTSAPKTQSYRELNTDEIADTFEHGKTPIFFAWLGVYKKSLMSQIDGILADKNLLLPAGQGGLCSSTCLANALSAFLVTPNNDTSSFKKVGPEILERLILAYKLQTQKDARSGVYVEDLIKYMNPIKNELERLVTLDPNEDITLEHHPVTPAENLKQWELHFQNDSLGLATVSPIFSPELSGHVIVVLGLNTDKEEIYISDPNSPNTIMATSYSFNSLGDMTFLLPNTYGDRVRLTRMSFLTRVFSPALHDF